MCTQYAQSLHLSFKRHFLHPTPTTKNPKIASKMPEANSASGISTHYYKIAHLLLVTYSIYTAKEPALDQYLLELELQIRHKHPKILLTYYNKCLYHFRFDHVSEKTHDVKDDPEPVDASRIQLHLLYPLLALKHEKSIPADQLANPSRVFKNTSKKEPGSKEDTPDDHLAFASLSFLKAVKKMLVYNLSATGHMYLFGNYVVGRVQNTTSQYAVVQIDPILLSNGDLIVSLSQRNWLALFDSSVLNLDHVFPDFALCFVVYVIPSGLRCHLYDTSNMQQSFTYTPPKSSENLLRLLKLSTGIDLSSKPQILWVKLIPNLQHLNNQTSKVSRFVHDVDNRKYILWPWELCALQFGSVENKIIQTTPSRMVDPLSLISDFMEFSILCHNTTEKTPENEAPATVVHTTAQPFSVPSAISTGLSSGEHKNDENNLDIQEIAPLVLDIFGLQQTANSYSMFNGEENGFNVPEEPKEASEKETAEDDDVDYLFGDSSDKESKEAPAPEIVELLEEDVSSLFEDENNSVDKPKEKQEDPISITDEPQEKNNKSNNDFSENPTFINIPRDQMISSASKLTPGSYKDPGAPLPVMPTPIIPQSSNTGSVFSSQTNATPQKFPSQFQVPTEKLHPQKDYEDQPMRYVFSPLHFNPMIKSNIDTKYGKGGKFYVARESSVGPDIEAKKKRLRETSVTYDASFCIQEQLEQRDMFPSSNEEEQDASMLDNATFQEEDEEKDEEEEDEEDDDYDEEESDVDEELNNAELKTSPLKLNTHGGMDPFQNGPATVTDTHRSNFFGFNPTFYGTTNTAFLSPSHPKTASAPKGESPFSFGMGTVEPTGASFSPPNDVKLVQNNSEPVNQPEDISMQIDNQGESKDPGSTDAVNTPGSAGSSSGISESSNCLPLILRSINVFTIPNLFMLNNVPGVWGTVPIAPGFNMDVDEEEDDFETCKNGELSVKLKYLDEFLKWLTPNLVFDLGLQNFENQVHLNLPDFFPEEVVTSVTDGEVSEDIATLFTTTFPLSYKICLNEFICGSGEEIPKTGLSETQNELNNQLSFLDDITNDDILNPESSLKKLTNLHWDSVYAESSENQTNFKEYKETMKFVARHNSEKKVDDESVFKLSVVKTKVLKHGKDIINLNFVGVKFWKYFNFSPVSGPKKFQVLLISENDMHIDNGNMFDNNNLDFLDILKNNYKENHFGSIKKLHLQTSDTRPDLEGINNGIMLIDKDVGGRSYGEYYKKINKKLKSLAELIKLDLINKSNRFEFDRPLLLLFINFDESINSVLQISKICRNFKLFLNNHQLSLVDVFAHIIPWKYIVKQSETRRQLRYLSQLKLSKLAMNLYNKCPNNESYEGRLLSHQNDETRKLFTQLVKEPPSTLHFKFLNKINKEGYSSTFHDDIFLHVAYERSVDKNWVSAAWSDPLGIVTFSKSWYCSSVAKNSYGKDAHDLGMIINDIWETSNKLFKTLNEDVIQRTCGSGSKKFLVLTRINSIIPDDELVFWKRLSAKYKDVSLIVLSANRVPKLLFSSEMNFDGVIVEKADPLPKNPTFDFGNVDGATANHQSGRTSMSSAMTGPDFLKSLNGFSGSNNSSPTAAGLSMTSPMNPGGLSFHSPHQFLNTPGNFLSPLDGGPASTGQGYSSNNANDADMVLKDPSLEILGVIPKTPLPSFNSPTRLGMRIGYLLREAALEENSTEIKYMVFEVTLLSCSAYWSLNAIMKILLNQYKKLIVLNDILGTYDTGSKSRNANNMNNLRSLVPWHINAVVKTLDYLVHVYVEEQN